MNYGLVESGKGEGGIDGGIGQSETGAGVRFYVEVDDLQAYVDKAVSLGGTVFMPVTDIPGAVTMAIVGDPEGNPIGMIKG